MKLSSFERQKRIAQQEREKVQQRITKIDNKLKQIDAIISELLASLDLGLSLDDYTAANNRKVPTAESKGSKPAAKYKAVKSKTANNKRFIFKY